MKIQTTATKLSNVNQTAVPSSVRKVLNLKKGDKILWEIDINSGSAKITTLPKNWGTYMRGLGAEVWKGVNVEEYIKELREDRDLS